MSATARRKQEEKHLRLVRELGARTHNRQCFECEQRGPTYIDITVGSFVCTSCSGILRGLNPPHRVKSISMTTFTEQEIEFLQLHGNEVCRQIWLGLFDSRSAVIPDYRDPQKIKEFLQDKYEKKRWYISPERVKVSAATSATTSLSSRSSTPDIKPLKSLVGESTPALNVTKTVGSQPVSQPQMQQPQQQQAKKSQLDLLADIGGDPFATPAPQQAFGAFPGFGVQQAVHTGFPAFNAFGGSGATTNVGSFPSANQAPFQAQSTTGGQMSSFSFTSSVSTGQPTVSSSQYAGAEYSSVFSIGVPSSHASAATSSISGTGSQVPTQQSTPSSASSFGAFSNPFAAPVAPQAASTNPFQTNGMAPVYGGVPAGYASVPATSVPGSFAGFQQHPFQQQQPQQQPQVFAQHEQPFAAQQGFGQQQHAFVQQHPFLQQQAFSQQQNGSGFGAFGQPKVMARPMGPLIQGGGAPSNPFMSGAPPGQFAAGSASTNPFL
ncbi:arf-GAP domain and FG repeat-containing protein 1-like isoform X3 [Hemitrygon akajei]|uniref:arf-GAP domain and FG repeat-containing protein 1-like isoform X3 n=1 Tax=Hemitrygon akajei TaxID=2704970 RepID=UPI003BF95038